MHPPPSQDRGRSGPPGVFASFAWLSWLAIVLFSLAAVPAHGQSSPADIAPAERTNLARLVDLAVERLHLQLDYDAKSLEGIPVALRLSRSVSHEELWALTNQVLASSGYTTVRSPGSATMSVVKLTDAASLTRVESDDLTPGEVLPGFAAAVIRSSNRSAKDLVDLIKPLLSKPGGNAAVIDDRQLLVSDLRPRLEQIRWLVGTLDAGGAPPIVDRYETKNLTATQLAGLVTAVLEAQRPLQEHPLRAVVKAPPTGEEGWVLLVAPPDEIESLRELLAKLDQRAELVTTTYSIASFDTQQVQTLLEQTARDSGPLGSGDRWRVVVDTLSGALVVTATPGEHERVAAAITRLRNLPAEARRPVRTYEIRNRSVEEMLALLQELITAGVLGDSSVEVGRAESTPFDPKAAEQRTPKSTSTTSQTSGTATPPTSSKPGLAGAAKKIDLTLTADPPTNTLLAMGEPRLLQQLEGLLKTLDVRQPQVMLEVLMISLTDAQTLDLGVELEKLELTGSTAVRLSSVFGLAGTSLTGIAGAEALPAPGRGFSGVAINPGDFGVLIRALETLNDGRSLNIPKVLVNNNAQGTLDSVLQVPFVSTNASDTVATTSFGGTQDAGTTITIKPTISAGDRLSLEYAVALSSFVGDSADPTLPPPKQQNNLQSVVTIPDGYTIALGGLDILSEAEGESRIPLIGAIPGIGEFFKTRSKTKNRSRFFVFIRAEIMRRDGFEDLKYVSDQIVAEHEVDDGWPEVEPRFIGGPMP